MILRAALAILLATAGAANAQTGPPAGEPPADDPPAQLQEPPSQQELFQQAMEDIFPMTPEMLREFKAAVRRHQQLILGREELNPLVQSTRVTLEPGGEPQQLTLTPGIASLVTVFDALGNPWPLGPLIVGNKAAYQVLALGSEHPHAFTILPRVHAGSTNLIVSLAGASSPFVVLVRIDPETAHFHKSFLVDARGPESPETVSIPNTGIAEPGSELLLAFLAATDLPEDAVEKPVAGVAATAWVRGDLMYVRSRHILISPAWSGSLAGPNGYKVWMLSDPTAALLFSIQGRVHRAKVGL